MLKFHFLNLELDANQKYFLFIVLNQNLFISSAKPTDSGKFIGKAPLIPVI